MRILIIGAGKVGSSVAGNLVSESNDITIVDTNKAKIAEIQSNYDLQGIVGDATSPSVLADAGAVDADMIIAVTANDETNLANYCASITMYPWLNNGTIAVGGNSTAPTNLKSFCGGFVNMVFIVWRILQP